MSKGGMTESMMEEKWNVLRTKKCFFQGPNLVNKTK